MTKEELTVKAKKRTLFDQLIRGIKKLFSNKIYTLIFLLVLIVFGTYLAIESAANNTMYNFVVMPFTIIILFLVSMLVIGFIPGTWNLNDRLIETGFVNKAGIPPELLELKKKDGLLIWKFRTSGIPLEKWQDNQALLESAMNISIIKIKPLDGKTKMLVYSVPAIGDLPEVCEWDDGLLAEKPTVLRLGEGLAGPVEIDLHKTPHILIGGSTGSGKTILIKLIMHECKRKGFDVVLADFKGGVDFQKWTCLNGIYTNLDDISKVLKNLVVIMEQRKDLLLSSGCSNIDEFNEIFSDHEKIPHIVFVCDELAEMLDKTGADKETKDKINEITTLLSTIARLGRAFAIHLVLGTQRPDANIIPGQIKNNMDVRICGRSDQVLSQIILDTSDAADKIPKDAQGRFLMADGTLFQAYYFDDNNQDNLTGEY